jgi:hypothetical protein
VSITPHHSPCPVWLLAFVALTCVAPTEVASAQTEPSRLVSTRAGSSLVEPGADPATIRFLEQLADRRLERSIVAWSEARLARAPAPGERLTLVLAALRARRSLALDAAPGSRDGLWEAATRREVELAESLPVLDREVVRLDSLCAELERAEFDCRLAATRANDPAGRLATRQRLLAALDQLSQRFSRGPQLPDPAERNSPTGVRIPDAASTWPDALQRTVERDIAWGWLSVATYSPSDDTLRQIAAEQAGERFERQLARPTTGEPRAEALLGRAMALATVPVTPESEAAAQRAEAAVREIPRLADRWLAWTVSRAEPQVSDRLLEQTRARLASDVVPQEDLALVEFDLLRSAARKCGSSEPLDPVQQEAFQSQVGEVLARFAARYRPRWEQIAQVKAQRLRLTSRLGERISEDVAQAEVARESGDLPTAVTAYRRAISTAALEQRPGALFELRSQAGSLLIEAEQWDAAARLLLEAATNETHGQAAEAHLLACYALGRGAELSGQRAEWIAAVDAHLARFAKQPTAVEAWWQRGQAALGDHDWAAAVAALEHVPAAHRRGGSALEGLGLAYRELLAGIGEAADERERLVKAARGALEPRLSATEAWGEPEMSAALFLAETALDEAKPDAATADRWLQRLESLPERPVSPMNGVETASETAVRETRRLTITRLRILALAGQGEIDAAQKRLTALNDHPDTLLKLLAGLDALAKARPETRPALARLEADTALRLDAARETLSPAQRIELDRALGAACLARGDHAGAILRYRRVSEALPNDRSARRLLAGLLATSDEITGRAEAVALYRKLEAAEAPGSIPWLESRLAVCRTLARDDRAAAKKLAQVTRLLYPKLGTPELAAAFAELAADVSQPRPATAPKPK